MTNPIDKAQPEALRLAHALEGGKLIDDSTEWAETLHAAGAELRRLHAELATQAAQIEAAPTAEARALVGQMLGALRYMMYQPSEQYDDKHAPVPDFDDVPDSGQEGG